MYFKWGNTTSSLLHEILLQVITVDFGSTENNCLIHLVFLDCTDSILPLQDFNSFRPHLLSNTITTKTNTQNFNLKLSWTHIITDLLLHSPKKLYFNTSIIDKTKKWKDRVKWWDNPLAHLFLFLLMFFMPGYGIPKHL